MGLIVSGIIIGPNGLNIISDSQANKLFATIGILFLMFIAGLDLDQQQFSRTRNKSLLFGLTSSHAAAILAVIMVGYRIGIIDDNVMNGTIILILVTCFVSSLVTEAAGRKIEPIATIDNNVASGIKRVAREKSATDIIIGTSGKSNLADILFGRPLEQLAANSSQTIFIYNAVNPINLYKNVTLFLPPNAEKEAKFRSIIDKVIRIAESNSIPLNSYSYGKAYIAIDQHIKKTKSLVLHNFVTNPQGRETADIRLLAGEDDLLVIFSPQRGSISWDPAYDAFMKKILRTTGDISYLIINPGIVS